MRQEFEGTLLRIHMNEDDVYGGRLLYEVIMQTCQELNIAEGMTVRALSGFGSSEHIHRQGRLTTPASAPVVITVVDTNVQIRALQEKLNGLIAEGLAVSSPVHVIRLSENDSL